jgi:hypothetical protein
MMLWHNRKSDKQGIHYMVPMTPMHASSLLARQWPWMTFGSAITCRTSHKQIRLNRSPTHHRKLELEMRHDKEMQMLLDSFDEIIEQVKSLHNKKI